MRDRAGNGRGVNPSAFLAMWALVAAAAALAVATFLARRIIGSQPGVFRARIRGADGAGGIPRRWRSGQGRWVRDVLVWNPLPLLTQGTLIPIEGVDTSGIRDAASPRRIHRGRESVVLPFLTSDRGRVEISVDARDREDALGPFAYSAAIGPLVTSRYSPLGADRRSSDADERWPG